MDISMGMDHFNRAYRALSPMGVFFHAYTNKDLLQSFPSLLSIRPRLPPFFYEHSLTLSKGFHIEAITLWWEFAKKGGGLKQRESREERKTVIEGQNRMKAGKEWEAEEEGGGEGEGEKVSIFQRNDARRRSLMRAGSKTAKGRLKAKSKDRPKQYQYNEKIKSENLVPQGLRKRMEGGDRLFDHVWVLEDDVGVSGGTLLDFIKIYDLPLRNLAVSSSQVDTNNKFSSFDFITYGEYFTMKQPNEIYEKRWVYHDVVSEEYARLIPELKQVHHHEINYS